MSELHIIAIISAKPEHADEVQSTLSALAAQVEQNEPNTLKYELLTTRKKGEFIFSETYKDKQTLAAHGKTDYFGNAMKKIAPLLAGPSDIKIVKKVGGYSLRSKL